MQNTDNKQAKLRYWGIALLSLAVVVPASARQVVNPYFSIDTLQLPSGAVLEAQIINGPPKPPPGFEIERQVVALPKPDLAAGVNILTVPAFNWVFGCSAVSGAMIAGYYDRSGWPAIYTGPTNGGVMPLDNSSWPTWSDGYDNYPSCPLIASKIGVDGRTTRGSIEDYWIQYGSTANDPYITNGWTQHAWGEAIGDYMWTSQSMFDNTDGSTTFYNWTSSADPLTCEDMIGYGVPDGTLGRRRFYEAKGYTVTDCYNQQTDNTILGGFSFAQFQAEIDAGRPVLLNLEGHSIVGVGYDSTSNLVYLHDTWDYSNHTMTWGSSYSGMALLSVSIVNLAPASGDFTLTGTPSTQAVCAPSSASYTIDVGTILGFANPVTLGATGQPSGTTATFNPNPVTPAGTSAFAIGNTGAATPGAYTLHVIGTATGGTDKSIDLGLSLFNTAPGAATLTAPADGATSVSVTPTFTWTPSAQAATYAIEVATDAGFSTIVASATGLTSPTWTPGTALNTGIPYFWRVRSGNACGTGGDSAMFQFTTQAAPGDCGPGTTANVLYQTGFEDGAYGWTSSGTGNTWALATTNPHSGVQHFHANDPDAVSDQRLAAPALTLPTGQNPLTMKFWHAPYLEQGSSVCYDGGILEVSTDGGANWTQVPEANLLAGPYTLPVSSSYGNPLAGLNAWCGTSSTYLNTIVDISAYAGQTVQFRARLGSDDSYGEPGWDLDDVTVQSCQPSTVPPTISVNPTTLGSTQPVGSQTNKTLDIGNAGESSLAWAITEEPAVLRKAEATTPTARHAPKRSGISAPHALFNPAAAVIGEGFEGGAVPPPGWSLQAQNQSYTWQPITDSVYSGNYAAHVLYDPDMTPQNEWLLSSPLELTSGTLSFWSQGSVYWCRDTYDNCNLEAWLVVGPVAGDGDDIHLGDADPSWPDNWTWAQSVFDLTPHLPNGPVRLGLRYVGTDGAEILLDEIHLDGDTQPIICSSPSEVPWLDAGPTTGNTSPGQHSSVTVSFDSSALAVGSYQANLCVASNDPVKPVVAVPVTLEVNGGSNCQATAMTVGPEDFGPGTHSRASEQSIVTQGAVQLLAGAEVTFRAPWLRFSPGFRVALGARLIARAEAVTCGATTGTPVTPLDTPDPHQAPRAEFGASLAPRPAPAFRVAPPRLLAAADQPAWLTDRLAAHSIDRAAIQQALLGADDQWLLFETTQALRLTDRNGTSDIYRLDLFSETLVLLSHTPQGTAGNGPSRYPTATADGDLVVFQSDADNLVPDDHNGVTDLFLHQVSGDATYWITLGADQAAAHPALDAAGQDLLYDQPDPAGQRVIRLGTPWGTAPDTVLSQARDVRGAPLDNHHPAISADGRYLAYLETPAAPDDLDSKAWSTAPTCQVHFYDRDSDRYYRQPCPQALAAASEDARPTFSADGTQVAWYYLGVDEPLILPNLLLAIPPGTAP